jgi:hypothetical protein
MAGQLGRLLAFVRGWGGLMLIAAAAVFAGHAPRSGHAAPTGLIGILVLVGVVTWLILEALRRRRR